MLESLSLGWRDLKVVDTLRGSPKGRVLVGVALKRD